MFDWWGKIVDKLVYETWGMSSDTALGSATHFYIYDTIKIFILLITIIFLVSFLGTYFNIEKVRVYLQGKSEFTGNILASLFGIITPFCSCSAIQLYKVLKMIQKLVQEMNIKRKIQIKSVAQKR